MSKLEYHRITPQIALYQQQRSPYWWVYLSFEKGGTERLSTKEKDFTTATEVAVTLYSRVKESKERGEITELKKYTSIPSFFQVCEEVKVWYDSHDFTQYTTYKAYSGLINNHLLKYSDYKDKYISTFTLSDIEELLDRHPTRGRTTLVNLKTVLKKVFDYSEHKNYIKRDQYPKFPEKHKMVKLFVNSDIDDADLSILLSENKEFTGNKFLTDDSRRKRELLFRYSRCLYFCGARAGDELLEITWSSFSVDFSVEVSDEQDDAHQYEPEAEDGEGFWDGNVYIAITEGKMKNRKRREIVLNAEAKAEFMALAEYQGIDMQEASRSELNQKCFRWGGKEGQHKGYNVVFSKFQDFLKENHNTYYQLSQDYSLTAFRHTYITKALVQGMRLEDIALNCGNEPQTIMKVYHHIISRMRRQHITKIKLGDF